MKVRGVMSGEFTNQKRLRCVIAELGSLSLAEASLSAEFDETIVIGQMQGESPAVFAERVKSRLSSLERLRRFAESGVVLVGSGRDASASAARHAVLVSLSRHLRARGAAPELILITGPEAASEHRADMLALAEAMLALPSAERVPIKMHFGQPRAA